MVGSKGEPELTSWRAFTVAILTPGVQVTHPRAGTPLFEVARTRGAASTK
jgi:hypothetical protein